MNTSIDHLLKRRFKVIADYPESLLRIGDILEDGQKDYEWWINNRDQSKWTFNLAAYPVIFKELDWHQDRPKEEMPKYIKWTEPHTKAEVFFEVFQWLSNSAGVYKADVREAYLFIKDISPVTEADYINYLNSKK